MKIDADVSSLFQQVVRHRRWLHQHPETGFAVFDTRDYVAEQLAQWGYHIDFFAETGIRAYFKGCDADRVWAFRSDMDALNIEENTGLSFTSKRKGFMHGCGHDGHMSILLGFAQWLSENKNLVKDDVILLFQPAEESEGGALPMIKDGALLNPKPDGIFGLHIMPDIPQGVVGLSPGPVMAQTCEFDVEILGKTAHGALPHKGVDALLAACHLVTSMQSMLTRRVDPFEKALITIGRMEAGDRRNIIAGRVEIEGIIRSFNDQVYSTIKKLIEELLSGLEISHGVKTLFKEVVYYPSVINDPVLVNSIRNIVPCRDCIEVEPQMTAEDFSYYQREVPGVYMFLGSGNEKLGYTNPLHSDCFDFDESLLLDGIQLYKSIITGISRV